MRVKIGQKTHKQTNKNPNHFDKGNMSAGVTLGARNRKSNHTDIDNKGHLLDGITEKAQ